MRSPRVLQICVEVEHTTRPIAGRVTNGDGSRRFEGWIELVSLLDETLGAAADRYVQVDERGAGQCD